MENQTRLWRFFFAIGLFAIAIQQMLNADFVLVILPAGYPSWLPQRLIWDWAFSALLSIACICIILEIKARLIALLTAGVLLLIVIAFQLPGTPYPAHLGSWINGFKELTFSGGALIVAGSLLKAEKPSPLENILEKLIPAGKYFFSITMIVFGYTHFLYLDFVPALVPNWIPWRVFWTEFAGVALMAGGLGILINIQRKLAANLLGIAIFVWFVILHIPRAIADPHSGNGNEITSVFEALSFCGIAFLIAAKTKQNKQL